MKIATLARLVISVRKVPKKCFNCHSKSTTRRSENSVRFMPVRRESNSTTSAQVWKAQSLRVYGRLGCGKHAIVAWQKHIYSISQRQRLLILTAWWPGSMAFHAGKQGHRDSRCWPQRDFANRIRRFFLTHRFRHQPLQQPAVHHRPFPATIELQISLPKITQAPDGLDSPGQSTDQPVSTTLTRFRVPGY